MYGAYNVFSTHESNATEYSLDPEDIHFEGAWPTREQAQFHCKTIQSVAGRHSWYEYAEPQISLTE